MRVVEGFGGLNAKLGDAAKVVFRSGGPQRRESGGDGIFGVRRLVAAFGF
jgi:hypothetical protein